jgi:hypothetical protein
VACRPLSQLGKTLGLFSKANIDGIHTKACFELAIVREMGFAVHKGLYHLCDCGSLVEGTNH